MSSEPEVGPNNKEKRRNAHRRGGGRQQQRRGGQNGPPTPTAPTATTTTTTKGAIKKRKTKRSDSNKKPNTTSHLDKDNFKTYPPHWAYDLCVQAYAEGTVSRGILRTLPSGGTSFVTCDRGRLDVDILIPGALERNRALHGDVVFVELIPDDNTEESIEEAISKLQVNEEDQEVRDDDTQFWQDDELQMELWNPIVRDIPQRRAHRSTSSSVPRRDQQRRGRVISILPPRAVHSELEPGTTTAMPTRPIVGSIKIMQRGTILLTPNNKSLPQFKCPASTMEMINKIDTSLDRTIFRAEYKYGSWMPNHNWPPCRNVQPMGDMFCLEDEIQALLTENNVNHGEFSVSVLKHVDEAVQSGLYRNDNGEMGWKPTPAMYHGRRDYRSERIFTIDPTTAKDLDDALHIKQLPDGRIEVGVHIADVSYFVRPDTDVDREAQYRATTVYLVDRAIPMLPRPLCEVACSLNENVERLAFSCVWRMNMDGTVRSKGSNVCDDDIWYGRTVIKSCARLDYATAQNIIDEKVATGEPADNLDESLWPKSRRPTGGHTADQVAADVRLMHRVAMARRRLRFENGALALNGIKLTFTLGEDGQTPMLVAPYPIRDSNRLVEEYMLMANYLVAQRLITHARDLAVLRYHPEPLPDGLENIVTIAKVGMNFDIDTTSSQTLHESLVRFGKQCNSLLLQCVTNLLMTPMQAAEYFVASTVEPEEWRHYALNIPFYTHFTSPIRRYADVLVHRLLQATRTIDGEQAKNFPLDAQGLQKQCTHCNEKRMAAKEAQERCDRIYLSMVVRRLPMQSQLGVVLSVGKSTFSVFLPSLGTSAMLYLQEHTDTLSYAAEEGEDGTRRILLTEKAKKANSNEMHWHTLEIEILVKLTVTVLCRDKPPIDIRLRFEGPWTE